MNLTTTIIGFGMSATFIVFVCIRLICGRIRQRDTRQMLEIDPRINLELPELRPHDGLEPVTVAAIPTMQFNHETFISSTQDAQCTICLAEYQEKEVLRIMPKCGHSFHVSCIDIWLRKQSTCPVCRLSVQDSFTTKHGCIATQGTPHMLDRSEVAVEHSQQWLPPRVMPSEGNGSN